MSSSDGDADPSVGLGVCLMVASDARRCKIGFRDLFHVSG